MRNHRSFIVLIASAMPWATATVAAAPAPVTWEELRRLPKDCPVIYDNDWLRDTNDDEYLLAKAHLGQANLKGYILSKDEWDHGRQYKTEDGRQGLRARPGDRPPGGIPQRTRVDHRRRSSLGTAGERDGRGCQAGRLGGD